MQITDNTRAFIDAEVYSAFILTNLHDGLLGEQFYRNVSDFANGSTLNIKTIGSVTIQETQENTPLVYSPIETGTITFQITEHKGDAWYVTDDLREDGTQIAQLMAARSAESTRAIQEVFETDFFAVVGSYYAGAADPFEVNGFAHLIVSSEANNVFSLAHLIAMRLAFDKANVPAEGRVFFCDPVVEATLNSLVNITQDVTPYGAAILEGGMSRGQRFVTKLFGWDVIQSNRLPVGDFDDGTTAIVGGVLNIFMCVNDDQTKPVMAAWRRQPKVEGDRNKDLRRDEFVTTCRYGFGIQRTDTLGGLATSATAY